MPLSFERYVASRYLRSKKKQLFLAIATMISIVSVAISVMVPVIVLAILNGFDRTTEETLLVSDTELTVRRRGSEIENYPQVIKQILTVEGVTAANGFTENQAILGSRVGPGVLIKGIPNEPAVKAQLADQTGDREIVEALFQHAVLAIEQADGSVEEAALPPLIVSQSFAHMVGAIPGESISLVALPRSFRFGMPQARRFVIAGTYRTQTTDSVVYASMDDAQKLFHLGSSASGIEIQVTDRFQAKAVGEKVVALLGPDFTATDWTEANRPMWEAMKLIKLLYSIVLALLIIMASVCVATPLVMLVLDKRRDIAVLKTMGTSNRSVLAIFLLQGAAVGGIGVLLGGLLGFIGCLILQTWGFPINEAVFRISKLPVEMHLSDFVLVGLCAFVVSLGAGFYPALRAARLRPAELFRE